MVNNAWLWNAFTIFGVTAFFGGLATLLLRRIFYKKEDKISLSKIERESGKTVIERYLVELNVNELIEKKAEAIEEKYKDLIFNMQREHFEIKKDIQGRLEKEMKSRVEAEQENEILKNELHLIKQKSDDQDRKIDELSAMIKRLEKTKS